MFTRCFTVIILLLNSIGYSQNIYLSKQFQFVAYEKVPAWACVVSDWEKLSPTINLYDHVKYKGHADFVSFGLKTGITFAQFKQQVQNFETRKYIPLFLYDLSTKPIMKNGISYSWVIRLEDYSYNDDLIEMGKTIKKLYFHLEKFIAQQSGKLNKGLVVLSQSEKAKPNISISNSLHDANIGSIQLSELINHFGISKTMVLNAGTAVGKLRFIKESETVNIHLNATDIVIFEKAPLRIQPVAGIITLEPQTPLSHVNLLAKNRGTINISTDKLSSIKNLEKLIGKNVKIVCDSKKIVVNEISQIEFDEFVKKQQKVEVDLLTTNPFVHYLVNLDTTVKDNLNVDCVGAKAANFSLIRKAIPNYVGKGYAIPFTYYWQHIKNCGAQIIIDSLQKFQSSFSPELLINVLERLRKKINSTSLDSNFLNSILKLQALNFEGKRIRLRSSTNCEDLPFFNGAGLYLSKGYSKKDGRKKLEKAILEIYASLWTAHAFEERSFYHINHKDVAMAILISDAYENEIGNGVVLTIPDGKNISIYINAQPGDNLVTNPKGGETPEAIFFNSANDTSCQIRSRSSFSDVFIQPEMDDLLQELKFISAKIHSLLTKEGEKFGTDIEFKVVTCFGEKRIIIKQARLIYNATPY